MYVSEEILRALDDRIRVDIQSIGDSYFAWLLVSTAIVVIGVALEGPELFHEIRGIIRRLTARETLPEPTVRPLFTDLLKVIGFVGWLLVILGVVGEGAFEALVSKSDGLLQTFNTIMLSAADADAEGATILAGNIGDRADKLSELLKTEQETTKRFQRQATESEAGLIKATIDLTDAQQRLDREVRRRAPRTKLFQDAHLSTDPRITRFRGQLISLVTCLTPEERYDDPRRAFTVATSAMLGFGDNPIILERNDAARELGRQLYQAGWNPTPNVLVCAWTGIRMYVDPSASGETQSAANQLAAALSDALLLGQNLQITSTLAFSEDSGFATVDRVRSFVILIANNPFQ